ncbi:hypothetical protein NLU13_2689 [Sarocladium strictum]|uniref:Major facilitator superfamily (MFS) profile domain-containing protein n=1 Tax=Sarocladium strictum TaxID=5046 RepID=A0AA39GLG4_SARSR|nr:hypothetical protein NLU13_2689 [Sarocladium strictum]
MKSEKTSVDIGPVPAQETQMRQESISPGTMETADITNQDPTFYRRLLKTIDWHLLPLMVFSYMIQFLDKQTLAQASIMGIVQDLNLVGMEFSWAGSIFYFGYLAASYPASLLMVRFPIGKYLTVTFLVWGVILACHAATHSFAGLLVVRFFLGAAESSVSPGFSLITGMWYRREEQPLRHGIWFSGNSFATMFGGLLAYAIAHIQTSLATWKWLFLIYAILTIVWAVVLGFFLPDSPKNARFLDDKQREGAIERIKVNQTGAVNHTIRWDQVWEALTDYKIWLLVLFQLANNIPNGAITTFGNLVMRGFGFSTLEVYLLTMPQGLTHGFFALTSTYLAGKFPKGRCIITAVCSLISLAGCAIIYGTENKGARLFAFYIFTSFASGIPLSLSLVSSNVAGYTKKATVSAMLFIAYCTGNIIGPFLFFAREAPRYTSGFLALIICFSIAMASILLLGFCWKLENKHRDRLQADAPERDEGATGKETSEQAFENDWTDGQNLSFRYVY